MKSKVDPCLFCGSAPCECNKPVKQNNRSRGHSLAKGTKPDKSPLTPPDKSDKSDSSEMSLQELAIKKPVSHLAAMRRAAEQAPKASPPASPTPKIKHHTPVISEDELVFNAAIRNLAPLLHPDEVERYAAIISSEPHPGERKAVWKMRRRDGVLE